MKRGLFVVGLLIALIALPVIATAQVNLPEEIAGYLSWSRANSQKSFAQSAHPTAKDIYYNDAASDTMMSKTFPFAEGSVILKERTDPDTLTVTTLYTMRKEAGFSPDGGDWQYGVFERAEDGSFDGGWMSVENAAMCMGCHSGAAETDYAFLSYLDQ